MLLSCPGCLNVRDESKWEQSAAYYTDRNPMWHYVCHICGTNFKTPVVLGVQVAEVFQPEVIDERPPTPEEEAEDLTDPEDRA